MGSKRAYGNLFIKKTISKCNRLIWHQHTRRLNIVFCYARMHTARAHISISDLRINQLTDAEWQLFLAFISCEIQFMARRQCGTGARNQMDLILFPFIFCNLIIEIFCPVPRRKIVIGQKWMVYLFFPSFIVPLVPLNCSTIIMPTRTLLPHHFRLLSSTFPRSPPTPPLNR